MTDMGQSIVVIQVSFQSDLVFTTVQPVILRITVIWECGHHSAVQESKIKEQKVPNNQVTIL